MPIEDVLARRITGIVPFNELPIDAEIWREAHGQHQSHRQLHAISAHRPGIVWGLDVFVSPQSPNTIVVSKGLGYDSEGQALVVSEPTKFTITEDKTTYITLCYEDNLDRRSAVMIGSSEKYYRLIEGRQVTATRELPKGPYLELARIDRSSAKAAIKEAENPFDPGEDELNLLFRSLSFPYCYADGSVGELCFLPKEDPNAWKPNRGGLISLLRYANGAGFHTDYAGLYNLRAPSNKPPFVLYVSAAGEFKALTDEQVGGLKKYLETGGLLVAEASGGSDPFAKGIRSLAEQVGAKLAKVETGHPLLSAHHVFPESPAGSVDGDLFYDEKAGILLSTSDYGAAWQGKIGAANGADPRERVRQSLEFGLNILAFASRRHLRNNLAKLV